MSKVLCLSVRKDQLAVIGKPDPERTEVVKAFVVLKATVPSL